MRNENPSPRSERVFLMAYIALTVILALAILAINFWVDPFARFVDKNARFSRSSAYTLNRSLVTLIEFEKAMAARSPLRPPPAIIIGDSTSNQLPDDLLNKDDQADWYNLSYGKATLAENVELIEYLLNNHTIGKIVWTLPFSRMIGDAKNEMTRSIRMVDRPWTHLLTFESVRGSFYVLRESLAGTSLDDPDLDVEESDRMKYLLERMLVELEGRPWPDDELIELGRLEAVAQRKGVPIVYTVMPIHPAAMTEIKSRMPDRYRRYSAFFANRCLFDLNRAAGGEWKAQDFVDPVHLQREHRARLTEVFLNRVGQACEKPAVR